MHRGILCSLVHTNPDSPVLLVHMLFTPRVPRLRADYNMPCFGEERLCVSHRHTHFSFYVSFKPCFLPSLNITHGLSQFVAMRLVHSVGKWTYRSGQSYPFIPERDRWVRSESSSDLCHVLIFCRVKNPKYSDLKISSKWMISHVSSNQDYSVNFYLGSGFNFKSNMSFQPRVRIREMMSYSVPIKRVYSFGGDFKERSLHTAAVKCYQMCTCDRVRHHEDKEWWANLWRKWFDIRSKVRII